MFLSFGTPILSALFLSSFSYAELTSTKMRRDSRLNGHPTHPTQSRRYRRSYHFEFSSHSESLSPQSSALICQVAGALQYRSGVQPLRENGPWVLQKVPVPLLHIQSDMLTIVIWKCYNTGHSQASKCLLQTVATGVPW